MAASCEMCDVECFKYRCPRCEKKTCSMVCYKDHCKEYSCSGERDKTKFISPKDFTTLDLLSDYRLLEDAARKADSAGRDQLKRRRDFKPKYLEKLVKQCYERRIRLRTLPYPMTKRKLNKTKYFDREKEIRWQVEWVFAQAETKYAEQISETATLREALACHITTGQTESVVRPKLPLYTGPGLDNVRLFMKVEDRPADSVRYYELNKDATLAENLKGKTIVEYPTIFVVLNYCALGYTLLEGSELPKTAQQMECEVKDGASSDSDSDSSDSSGDSSTSSNQAGATSTGLPADDKASVAEVDVNVTSQAEVASTADPELTKTSEVTQTPTAEMTGEPEMMQMSEVEMITKPEVKSVQESESTQKSDGVAAAITDNTEKSGNN